MKNLQKGFTLIELLVVVAIIGILSTVVLASLGTARAKAKDAKVKSALSSARAEAELLVDPSSGSYPNTICTSLGKFTSDANSAGATLTNCVSTTSSWAIGVRLPTGTAGFCVDSTGVARDYATVSSSIALSGNVCPTGTNLQ